MSKVPPAPCTLRESAVIPEFGFTAGVGVADGFGVGEGVGVGVEIGEAEGVGVGVAEALGTK